MYYSTDLFKHTNSHLCHTLSQEELKQLQNVLSDILKDVTDFCEENNISYALVGGTLLGARRHNGFIPWDDDIDICMPRQDLVKFEKSFTIYYSCKYELQTSAESKTYPLLFDRVRKIGTSVKTRDDLAETEPKGAFIDIYPLENVPDNVLLRSIYGAGCMILGGCLSCCKFYRDRKPLLALSSENKQMMTVVRAKVIIGFFFSALSVDRWRLLADKWNSCCKNESSRLMCIPAGRKKYVGELYKREDFFPLSKMQFGEMTLSCPKDTDSYLKNLYGDFMTPPSECNRELHAFLEPFYLE